jgi:hypothetical protein
MRRLLLFRTAAKYHFSVTQARAIKLRPKDGQMILLFGTLVKGSLKKRCMAGRI